MTLLDRIAGGHPPQARDARALRALCVVCPIDPEMTPGLEQVLGAAREVVVTIRLPGAVLPGPEGGLDPVLARAIAAACFVHGCSEVLLLGLEGASDPDAVRVTDRLRALGVERVHLPSPDLRSFLGMIGETRGALVAAAAALREVPFLPPALPIHVGVVNADGGGLSILERGYDHVGDSVADVDAARGPVELAAPVIPVSTTGLKPLPLSPPLPPVAQTPAGASVPPSPGAGAAALPVPGARPRPKAASERPRAGARAQAAAPRAPRPAEGSRSPLAPEAAQALTAVRTFLREHLDEAIRGQIRRRLDSDTRPAESQAMARLVIDPVLKMGSERYRVLNELLVLQEALARLPPATAQRILLDLIG